MYDLNHIRIGIKNPNLALRQINRHYYDYTSGHKFNANGIKIIDEDWDVLVILDAFRYDMFASVNTLDGKLKSKMSRGSNTSEFLYGNFADEECLDTVYTTASPQFQKHHDRLNTKFYEVNNVWNTSRWDEDVGTVYPEEMTEVSKEYIENHPHKRHIIHYLQPHYPFINTDLENVGRDMLVNSDMGSNIWGLQMRGQTNLTKERINKAYYENCKRVLAAVEDLLDLISGKIVITSDHGNMVGERSRPIPIKEWGHPSGIYTRELVEVPWLVIENGSRPQIYSEGSIQEREDVTDAVVEDRLKDLGYV